MMKETVYSVLLAGGTGSRMHSSVNKVLLPVAGIPCIARSALALAPFTDYLVLVGRPEEKALLLKLLEDSGINKPILFASGGATRQESVHHGLHAAAAHAQDDNAVILIHDGARCLVSAEVIQNCLHSLYTKGSGAASISVTDTLRKSDQSCLAGITVPRNDLQAMQTPQCFYLKDLLIAFSKAAEDGFEGTDDTSVMVHAGFPVFLSEGSRFNLKLTTREDLEMAEKILRESSCRVRQKPDSVLCCARVGLGYDVHQLVESRKLILCGVEIPYSMGLLGHSDADVALHALMDALLGAAGLGDIGRHFPDTDARYKGISSMELLESVIGKLSEAGYHPSNADITIVAQKPKLAPYIPLMSEKVASALDLPLSRVNIKATTTEHLGFEGRMEGISAQAVCLVQPL